MADGILTQDEESRLREFLDRLSLADTDADRKVAKQMERTSTDRITFDARLAALTNQDPDTLLSELSQALRQSGLNQGQQTALPVRAWEAAVEAALEDGVLTQVVKAAVIRDITEGIVPDRQNITGRVPFNLMKSEKLVWVMTGVDYLEVVTRRERRGNSHGLSIRVARGVYFRPGNFRSRSLEWEKTVHQDTGLLGFTTKHLYFSGPKKKFRVRYDRIVDFEPFDDGFGLMRDAQTAKPQSFRTGDGWFAYNLAVNLAQI